MHHLRAQGQKQPSGPRHAWIKRFFCASVHLISIIAGCLPRKFLPEAITHDASQALLHENWRVGFLGALHNFHDPVRFRDHLVLSVARFGSDNNPIRLFTSLHACIKRIMEGFQYRLDAQKCVMAPREEKLRLWCRCRASEPHIISAIR